MSHADTQNACDPVALLSIRSTDWHKHNAQIRLIGIIFIGKISITLDKWTLTKSCQCKYMSWHISRVNLFYTVSCRITELTLKEDFTTGVQLVIIWNKEELLVSSFPEGLIDLMQQPSVCCVWQTIHCFYLQPWPENKFESTKSTVHGEFQIHVAYLMWKEKRWRSTNLIK